MRGIGSRWQLEARDGGMLFPPQIRRAGNRMNLVMKKVTSWAAIIAVPTATIGFYGKNLPYPGFGKADGLWWSVGLIVGIGTILYIAFKRWE